MKQSELLPLCDELLYKAKQPTEIMDTLTDQQREALGLAAWSDHGSIEDLDEVKDVDLYLYYEDEIRDVFETLYTMFDYSRRDENGD